MIQLADAKHCTGCHACYSVCPVAAIEMQYNYEGFLYPVIDESKCIECELCVKACPILNKKLPLIEQTPKAYAAYHTNEEIRMQSSSGGVFTAIAENVINNNGIVFGAKFADDFYVVHDWTDTIEGLSTFRGSKYVQSTIGNSFKDCKKFLEQGRLVLFTGTPCQIGGLKAYLKKEYDNLICVDFICHGVPSPKLWQKYILFIKRKFKKNINLVKFRDKQLGWLNASITFKCNNKILYSNELEKDTYGKLFLHDLILRESCYNCSFKGFARYSDLTIADLWGANIEFKHLFDNKGISLFIINNKKGLELKEHIINRLKIEEIDLKKALKYNPLYLESAKRHVFRNFILYFKFKNFIIYDFIFFLYKIFNYFIRIFKYIITRIFK